MDQDIKLSGPFLSASCHDDKGLTLEALSIPPVNRTATKTDVLGLRGGPAAGQGCVEWKLQARRQEGIVDIL